MPVDDVAKRNLQLLLDEFKKTITPVDVFFIQIISVYMLLCVILGFYIAVGEGIVNFVKSKL